MFKTAKLRLFTAVPVLSAGDVVPFAEDREKVLLNRGVDG